MRTRTSLLCVAVVALGIVDGAARAAEYKVDPIHTSVSFRVSHLKINDVHGRFNDIAGTFTFDPAKPAASKFEIAIPVASIDTGNKERDDHLRNDDFFDARQFPALTFKSTSVKASDEGLLVSGDLTLHGKTKPVTITLKNGGDAEAPPGTHRTGFNGGFTIKRSDFGVGAAQFADALGDEVIITLGVQGIRQ